MLLVPEYFSLRFMDFWEDCAWSLEGHVLILPSHHWKCVCVCVSRRQENLVLLPIKEFRDPLEKLRPTLPLCLLDSVPTMQRTLSFSYTSELCTVSDTEEILINVCEISN